MMAEFEQRAKRVAEVTGVEVDIRHARSVLTGCIDLDTLKHVSTYIGEGYDETEFAVLKSKIMEFVNMMDNVGREGVRALDARDNSFGVVEDPWNSLESCENAGGEADEWWNSPDGEDGRLLAFAPGACWICGREFKPL